MNPILVALSEWERLGPEDDARLKDSGILGESGTRRIAQALAGRVDVRQTFGGIEILSTSWVGSVDVGNLRLRVLPKLPGLPLTRLLRYAYGLRDLTTLDETHTPVHRDGFQDLLITMLADEVEELLSGGLARRYVEISGRLSSPRGRIMVGEIASRGGMQEAALPCRYFERHADWLLNRVLRAGLELAGNLAGDQGLRWRVHRLAARFESIGRLGRLMLRHIDQAEQSLTRITAANRPALTLVRLLHGMNGIELQADEHSCRVPGFLFDMNRFFQSLLSRFLRENLEGARIEDEQRIRNLFAYASDANPRQRRLPQPRPDFALLRQNRLCTFLDAKYRDIWKRDVPAGWLYQLSIYALSSPSRVSVMLYPSMDANASDERIIIHPPVRGGGLLAASVIVRPVPLEALAEIVSDRSSSGAARRWAFAHGLVSLDAGRGSMRASCALLGNSATPCLPPGGKHPATGILQPN